MAYIVKAVNIANIEQNYSIDRDNILSYIIHHMYIHNTANSPPISRVDII